MGGRAKGALTASVHSIKMQMVALEWQYILSVQNFGGILASPGSKA